MGADLLIANFLRVAREDLDGAKQLAAVRNRNADYLCEQAAKKIILAVLTSEGIHGGIKHDLDQLVVKLPDVNRVKLALHEVTHLSKFATAYRYPTPQGRILAQLEPAQLTETIGRVERLLIEISNAFGVDLASANTPAKTPGPIR